MSLLAKRILITGATGFVGANLVRRLLKTDNKIHLIIRASSVNLWRLTGLATKNVHEVDLLDELSLAKIVSKIRPEIIFHLAAYGSYPREREFSRIFETNVTSTLSLYNACSRVGFEIFVNTGSSSEYGIFDKPMSENLIPSPITLYGSTKAAATIILAQLAKENKQFIATLRPFSVYGPFEERFRLIPTLITGAVLGKEVDLASKKSVRDYVFVEDLIDAYLLAATKRIQGIFNIGGGKEYSNLEVFKIVKQLSGGKLLGRWGKQASRPYEVKHWICDNTRARKTLGWKPKHSLEEGLLATHIWFKKNIDYYV